jgi:ABC-2 type transport system permease protein
MVTTQSDLRQFWTAFRFQLRSYLRTWRFLGLLIFVTLVSVALLAIQLSRPPGYITTTDPTASIYLSSYLGFLADAVIITAAFLGGDALSIDLAGGPGYLMLTQPVRRSTLLLGRYVAAGVTGLTIALVYYAFATAAVLHFYSTVPVALATSLGCAFLFGLAVLAVAFFFSSFFRNPTVGIVASLLILIIGFPIITSIGDLTGVEPWFSLDYGSGIITNVLSAHFQHMTSQPISVGKKGGSIVVYTFSPFLWEGITIVAGYLAAFLGVSYLIYRFKEVKG